MLREATAAIDSLDVEVLTLERTLEAERAYFQEVLALKDQHIVSLETAIKDNQPSLTKGLLEKLLWGLGGYGVRAASE